MDGARPMTRGPLVQEPINLKERLSLAKQCTTAMAIAHIPTLVDLIDDKVSAAYQGHPDRLFLVGKDGKMAYSGGRGPFGFRPDELDRAIRAELAKVKSSGQR